MRTRFLLLIAASAVACGDGRGGDRDPAPRDGGTGRDAGTIVRDGGGAPRDAGPQDPEACPPGATLHYFSLHPIDSTPPVSSLDLPALPQNASVQSAGDGNEHSVRFDFCEVGGVRSLARVLYLGESFEVPRLYVRDDSVAAPTEELVDTERGRVFEYRLPASHFLVEGLDGAPEDLRIRLVGDTGLLFVGHASFVAVARGNVTASSIVYTSSTIVTGELGPGDVFGELECQFGESPMSKTFVFDTATFEVDACTFLGGGFTAGYRITNLAITDTNAALSSTEQQRMVFEGEDAVNDVLDYQWNHHNACDSFHLALPHADYAASTSPAAGCGATVPNAPEREFDENPILPVLYRIRYHGGAWMDGSLPGCNHYLFCN